ncbi:MAG: hypothetical protein IJ705_04825, partial [Oscillospiraceae bacterium]|nr:hypothetical protein [Oscillospiraceae bacterium]
MDEENYREVFSQLHSSVREEEIIMKEKRKKLPKAAAVLLAAAMVLTLSFTALAASGVFSLGHRDVEQGERFRLNFVTDRELYWTDAKQVFTLEGPGEAHEIRFKPGWLPANPAPLSSVDAEGWYTRLTCEGGGGQPCLIETFYAPQFSNGGHLILLYDEPKEIIEETWGEYQVLRFEAARTIPATDYRQEETLKGAYVLLFQPEEGYLIVISGQSPLPELERVAKELTVEPTKEVLSAADYQGENRFIDW